MSRRKDKSRSFLYLFIGIVIFASIINGITLFGQSIRLDEAQSIWVATKPIATIMSLTSQDVHVPLYNVLLHFWIQIFGSDISIIRTLSFIFFILTLPVLYLFAKEASERRVALVTVCLFSFSPFILWYTSEARMYTLFTFVTSLNHLFFLRVIRSQGIKGKLGYFISLLLGLYTHYFFLFLVFTQGIYILMRWVVQARKQKNQNESFVAVMLRESRLPVTLFSLMLGGALFFIPWVAYVFLTGGASQTQPLIPPPTTFNVLQTFINFIFGFQPDNIQGILISLWPLSVLILFFVFTKRNRVTMKNIDYFVLVTFLPVIVVFLISFIRSIFLSRYLILVTPTFFFLIAWILMHYTKRVATYVIVGILVLMTGFYIYQNTSSQTPVREDYKSTTQYLSSHAKPSDIILVSAPFTVYPIEYYYTGTARIATIPEWDRYKRGSIPPFSLTDLEKSMNQYKKDYYHVYLVLSYDQGYEKTIRKYFDRYQLLMHERFSEGLEVREYRLRYD